MGKMNTCCRLYEFWVNFNEMGDNAERVRHLKDHGKLPGRLFTFPALKRRIDEVLLLKSLIGECF